MLLRLLLLHSLCDVLTGGIGAKNTTRVGQKNKERNLDICATLSRSFSCRRRVLYSTIYIVYMDTLYLPSVIYDNLSARCGSYLPWLENRICFLSFLLLFPFLKSETRQKKTENRKQSWPKQLARLNINVN